MPSLWTKWIEQVRASCLTLGGRSPHTSRASAVEYRRPVGGLSAPKSATKMADLTPHWARLSRCSGEGVKQLLSACAGRSGLPRQSRVTAHTLREIKASHLPEGSISLISTRLRPKRMSMHNCSIFITTVLFSSESLLKR